MAANGNKSNSEIRFDAYSRLAGPLGISKVILPDLMIKWVRESVGADEKAPSKTPLEAHPVSLLHLGRIWVKSEEN